MIRLMTAAGWPAAALVCVPWLCPTFATAAEHNGTTAQCTYPRHTLAEQGRTQQQHRDTTQSALDQRPVQTRPCHLRPVGSSRGWKVVEQSEAGRLLLHPQALLQCWNRATIGYCRSTSRFPGMARRKTHHSQHTSAMENLLLARDQT